MILSPWCEIIPNLCTVLNVSEYIDGQTLVLEDIETDLPTRSAEVLLKSKWTFITQEVHVSYLLILFVSYLLNWLKMFRRKLFSYKLYMGTNIYYYYALH